MKSNELDLMIIADARAFAKEHGIASVERGDSVIFGKRLEYNTRANSWLDLKTGECGLLKGSPASLLRSFFPQLPPRELEKGGAR